jgi:hypothetical protein
MYTISTLQLSLCTTEQCCGTLLVLFFLEVCDVAKVMVPKSGYKTKYDSTNS